MSYYKFGPKDILRNRIKAFPDNTFFVNDSKIYYNNRNDIAGANVENVTHVPSGHISLYELNIDRKFSDHTYDPDTNVGVKAKIFPFITKDSSLNSFATVSTNDFNQFLYGDIITGSYPFSASITRELFDSATSPTGSHLLALKNTLNFYTPLSQHYAFSSSLGDKGTQDVTLISIPSIFYDTKIKNNSVKLDFFISGTLVARCEDKNRNGELIQTSGSEFAQANGSNKVAGVVLYNEGFVVLTGSWNLTEGNFDFGPGSARKGTWKDFAAGANDGFTDVDSSASFSLKFQGTNYINTMTMNCEAPLGDLNFSSNPTFVNRNDSTSITTVSGSGGYFQNNKIRIKNTISSSFYNYDEDFKRQTFISKIGIYDENKNLIAVANLAKPVKKLEETDYTFRLKLDI
tara:strand:- start:770 stop:1978 length:1209 start_codon:yes stop_codon:yes gene_type:complete